MKCVPFCFLAYSKWVVFLWMKERSSNKRFLCSQCVWSEPVYIWNNHTVWDNLHILTINLVGQFPHCVYHIILLWLNKGKVGGILLHSSCHLYKILGALSMVVHQNNMFWLFQIAPSFQMKGKLWVWNVSSYSYAANFELRSSQRKSGE